MKRRSLLRAGLGVATFAALFPWGARAVAAPVSFFESVFPDAQGESHAMVDFLGQPLVVNFWATWCPPCVKEMPDLDFVHARHQGIQMVGVAIDTSDNVLKFGDKVTVHYPLLIAGHGGIRLMKALGNTRGGLPFTIVFDAEGQVLRQFLGQIDRDELDHYLSSLTSST